MKGLFEDIEVTEPHRDSRGRKATKKTGHYAKPGTGPVGETCGTCRHAVGKKLSSKSVYKCGLARSIWTSGPGSDIRLKDAACGGWRAIEAEQQPKPEPVEPQRPRHEF